VTAYIEAVGTPDATATGLPVTVKAVVRAG
jgi:hypothetical protein